MIKKIFVCLAFAVITITTNAQNTLKFAYFNYTEVLKSMPEYAAATHSINDLRAQYDAETTRSENDFHTKYEEFLEGQRNFAPSILKNQFIFPSNQNIYKKNDRLNCKNC